MHSEAGRKSRRTRREIVPDDIITHTIIVITIYHMRPNSKRAMRQCCTTTAVVAVEVVHLINDGSWPVCSSVLLFIFCLFFFSFELCAFAGIHIYIKVRLRWQFFVSRLVRLSVNEVSTSCRDSHTSNVFTRFKSTMRNKTLQHEMSPFLR